MCYERRAAVNFPRRGAARRRDRRPDRRRAPRRGRQRLADPGDRRAAGARARQRPALRVAAAKPQAQFLHRRRARIVRLRRPGPHRRVLPVRRRRSTAKATSIWSSIGDYEHPKVRFPGSFGSAYLYYVVPKVILFRTEHSRRTLVPKVDFISAPGAQRRQRLPHRRADRAGHQPLPVLVRRRAALHARKRASRPHASRR